MSNNLFSAIFRRKSYFIFLIFGLVLSLFSFNYGEANNAEEIQQDKYIIVFVREGCGACAKEKEFLSNVNDSSLNVEFLDIGEKENYETFERVTKKYNLSKVTPITLTGG